MWELVEGGLKYGQTDGLKICVDDLTIFFKLFSRPWATAVLELLIQRRGPTAVLTLLYLRLTRILLIPSTPKRKRIASTYLPPTHPFAPTALYLIARHRHVVAFPSVLSGPVLWAFINSRHAPV